ncbi:MAG: ROK family protein [Planctomycetota bacterium]|nr:ROK family protein [Planctomycetota bacterium]
MPSQSCYDLCYLFAHCLTDFTPLRQHVDSMPATRSIIGLNNADEPLFAGVDVGGTNTKIGIVDNQGRTLAFTTLPTEEEKGAEDAVQRMALAIRRLAEEHGVDQDSIQAIGLGTPGSMDIEQGMIVEPPNMPHWRNFPIRDRLSLACGKPVRFANDANAAAYGEFWVGSGKSHSSLIMLTLGTGVGGGVVVHGQLIDGVNSFGSECGHMIVDSRPDARLCVWGGGRGELEAYASAPAVVARTQEVLSDNPASSVHNRVGQGETLSSRMLAEEAENGDAFATEIVLETGRYLGIAVTTLVHIIDPGVVILGGAMNFGGSETDTGRRFLAAILSEFQSRAYGIVRDKTTIKFAALGGDAGYIGAAGIARAARGG